MRVYVWVSVRERDRDSLTKHREREREREREKRKSIKIINRHSRRYEIMRRFSKTNPYFGSTEIYFIEVT